MFIDTDQFPWPEPDDQAVVALHDCLMRFMEMFDSHYFGQIHR